MRIPTRFAKACQKYSLPFYASQCRPRKEYAGWCRTENRLLHTGIITWATKEPKSVKTKTSKLKNPIPSLVERGFALHQQLLILNEEFKQIKDRLKAEAAARPGEHIPLLEKESTGEQWIARGDDCECRIVFPAPQLKTDLDPTQPLFLSVKGLAGDHFGSLYRKVTTYEAREKKSFRGQVANLLKPEEAARLLDLCSAPSEPKAFWKSRAAQKEKP